MAAVVSALDTHNPVQRGENGHVEHGWSNDRQERILQLSFQLTRTKDPAILVSLGNTYRSLVVSSISSGTLDEESGQTMTEILYKMMLHTRDIVGGKGEYALFYELLSRWVGIGHFCADTKVAETAKALTRRAIISLVKLDGHDHGYGSWKDMKYFLRKLKERFPKQYEALDAFQFILHLMKTQLEADAAEEGVPSLLGRWAPRETSKSFGWIARPLAELLYSDWIKTATTPAQKRSASLKCLIHYRQLVTRLSAATQTPQVKMCAGEWKDINFDKDVTSITLSRSKRAFEFVDKRGVSRGKDDDRVKCRTNYKGYIDRCKSGKTEIKAARVSLVDMVKDAVGLSRPGNPRVATQIDCVNEQWKAAGKQVNALGNFVCMVDTSGSMECDNGTPLHAAIGLGLRACEKSVLGERVLTFSANPKWLNLENKDGFVDKVAFLKGDNSWGQNTNFHAALQLVADACVEKNVPPAQVKDLVLAIFSDMEIDYADSSARTMDEQITKMFHDAGMRSKFNIPYEAPHRLYWNLRSTSGFPSLSATENVSMMSGFSPVLLNSFTSKGMEALQNFTPWRMLLDQLNNDRYSWARDAVSGAFQLEPGQLPSIAELPNVYEPPELIGADASPPETSGGWFQFGLW